MSRNAPILILPMVLAACATGPGGVHPTPIQVLPDLECSGKIVLSASGSISLSSAMGANNSNNGTLQADCGDGFRLLHHPTHRTQAEQ